MKNYYLDIETYKKAEDGYYYPILDTNEFLIGAILSDEDEIEYFYNAESMYQEVMQRIIDAETEREICTFWGHNHEYDFYGYMKAHMKELLKTDKLILVKFGTLLAFITSNLSIREKEKHIFTDTMSFFYESLESLGESLGTPKGHMPEKIKEIDEIKPYLTQDVKIIKKAITEMRELYKEIGFNPKKLLTGSGVSMSNFMSFLHRRPDSGWIMKAGRIHKYEETIPFLRQANKGARVSVFKEGKYKYAYKIDLNSAYWKEMTEMPFPDLLKERIIEAETLEQLGYEAINRKEGVVELTINVPDIRLGVLATRIGTEKEYSLEFPNKKCQIRGTWSIYEINYALTKGYEIVQLHKAVIYERNLKTSPLRDYILLLWDLKQKYKNNKFKKKCIKLMGNGLYGKFIQRKNDYTYKYIERHELNNYVEQGWEPVSTADDYIIRRKEGAYIANYVSIYLGLRITGGTRIRLIQEMEKIPEKDLLYCDTDAIIFTGKENLKKFNISDELGAFKLESEGETNIATDKVYYVGEDVHIAGLSKRLQTKSVIDNREEVVQKKMIGFKDAIRNNNFELIGRFTDKKYEFNQHTETIIPEYYEEVRNIE